MSFSFYSEIETKATMPIYTYKGDYLLVECDEQYSLNLFIAIIHEVAERSKKESSNKVLVDITGMTGSPSIIDRYETGVEIAKFWGGKLQAACVAEKSLVNFSAETVAVNRGANFKVFLEMNEALEWLGII